MKNALFVTATDTDVGKTLVSSVLMHHLLSKNYNASYIKPVETGLGDDFIPIDPKFVSSLNPSLKLDVSALVIKKLKYPLSPYDSLRMENRPLDTSKLLDDTKRLAANFDYSIVEGAGGVYVPIVKDYWMIDFIKDLNIPTVVVARCGLGTINHTVLTLCALKQKGIEARCFIFNGEDNKNSKNNIENIERFTGIKCAGKVPYLENITGEAIKNIFLDYKLIFGF